MMVLAMFLRFSPGTFAASPRWLGIGLAAAMSLGLAACGKGDSTPPAASKPDPKASAKSVKAPAAQKQFLTIEAVDTSRETDVLALPGRVTFRPQAQSAIGATTAGRVVQLLVRPGEAVKAGAPLLTIESADAAAARATLDVAVSKLATADTQYRRNVEMIEKGVGLEIERQEAAARLKEARAEHDRARQTVNLLGAGQGSHVTVRAPSDGIVMAIRVAVGATVAPGGDALLELGDPSRLQIVAQVLESDLRRITVGQEAEVELPALAARVAARVETFSPRVDAESRRAQIYLALSKPPEGLRAGMLAQIALRVGAEAGIALPVSAVLIKDGKRRIVYVERPDGAFEAREVKTGPTRDGRVTILQGLSPGEKVVVRGALLLDNQAEQLL
jgi:cobalt-zinc-cadmium efflux system membrane fusion protein